MEIKIKIVNYNKEYEKDINDMLIKQWNQSFFHKDKIIGKVALANDDFAGVCFGWEENPLIYLDTLCIRSEYQRKGIGTLLLKDFINNIRHSCSRGGG